MVFETYFSFMLFTDQFFVWKFIALVLAVTIHEAAHAYSAFWMGDPTPHRQGRLTLNPLKHMSLIGTLMIIFGPIGWGKPVMFDPRYFRDRKWGTILTALAGPLSNFVLAYLFAIPLKYVQFTEPTTLWFFLTYSVNLNIMLMVFNLLPIPPLDGSKVVMSVIPNKYHFRYEMWMARGGLRYFAFIFFADYFLIQFTGYSILFEVLNFMALPVRTLIFLGV